MKIFYCGLRNNNYLLSRGESFEHENFYSTFASMNGVEVFYFPFDVIPKIGRRGYNAKLLEAVKKEKPDLVFSFMYSDELIPEALEELKHYTKTLAWFADDSWRFYNYSRYYAPHFTWVITTYSWISALYRRYGRNNIIRAQWAFNPACWKPIEISKDIDVSFIGQYSSSRGRIINKLRRAGINVYVRGWGWPEGRISKEEMINIFSRSKINLNINISPDLWRLKSLGRLFLKASAGKIVPDFLRLVDNFKSWRAMAIPQIKARPFELAGCCAFVITGYADDLENFYKENEEMVFYRSTAELIDKIKYYLPREAEREKIAQAGYERTLRNHTYEKRFKEIFNKIL